MDRIRLIFYIHNKQNKPVSASIEYDYQQEYFNVVVCEKLDWIASNQQGREVIEVTLRAEKDLNGVSDVHIRIDNSQYDIWLPLTFINFITDSRL